MGTVHFSAVAQSTLWDPMDCSTPGFPVHHQLPEFTQTHIHQVDDAIQPFHPLSSHSPPAFNLSQHQGLLKWVPLLSTWNYHNIVNWLYSIIKSVQFSRSVMPNSLWPHWLQHARLPCPSPIPRTCLNSCPLSQWHPPTISSSVITFSSCLQSWPASESFPVSQFFASGGQRIETSASASVLAMNIQDWFPLVLTGLISWQSKGLSRVFSNTTVQKLQFFGTQLYL